MSLGIGIIGFRGHGGTALREIIKLKEQSYDIELVAAYGKADEYIPEDLIKSVNPDCVMLADWHELIARTGVDVLIVDGPYHLHATMSRLAIEAGQHVYCEKCVALTWDDLNALKKSYDAASVQFWSMMDLRGRPDFYTALQSLKNGAIGKLKTIRMQKSYKLGTRPEWYGDREQYGGTIPWVGSHALDLMYAAASSVSELSALQQMGPDNYATAALINCAHENGVISHASLDYYRPGAAETHGDDRLRMTGSDGVIEVINNEVHLIDDQGERMLDLEAPAFSVFGQGIISLLTGAEPLIQASDVFAVTALCLAARDSADAGSQLIRVSKEYADV